MTSIVGALLFGSLPTDAQTNAPTADHFVYLPTTQRSFACPQTSQNKFDLTQVNGGYYKGNRLTDENADFRLSILGYAPALEAAQIVTYSQQPDGNAVKLSGLLRRVPTFVAAYRVRNWNWDDGVGSSPPYGTPGAVNGDTQIPPIVLDVDTTLSEAVFAPTRGLVIDGANHVALVLYAAETEITLMYGNQDSVVNGYLVHLVNLCVDPNLVLLYRAQLSVGKRSTGKLPAVRSGQQLGTASGAQLTLAVRDTGRYMDVRSAKDWWR